MLIRKWLDTPKQSVYWEMEGDESSTPESQVTARRKLGHVDFTLRGYLTWDSTRRCPKPDLPELPLGRYPSLEEARDALEAALAIVEIQ